jgi:FAD:protein FMN transferase
VAEHRVEQVMGMPVCIDVRDAVGEGVVDAAFAWLRFVDATFSTYRPGSEIGRLEHGTLRAHDAHPAVREVLARCDELRAATGGFFDARATGRLDPSALVKGWAVDHAAELLERAGARRFYLNAGGDVLVRGGAPWRVGIQHPRRRDRLACVVEVSDGAVATSGGYERGPHVVDPHTGRPPRGVLSFTVIGPRLATADAYATAAFAMGARGPGWTASLRGHEAMTILECDRVLSTRGFLGHCPGGTVTASLTARPSPSRWRRRLPDLHAGPAPA